MSQSLSPFGCSVVLHGPKDIVLTAQQMAGSVEMRLVTDTKEALGHGLGAAADALSAQVTHVRLCPVEGLPFISRVVDDVRAQIAVLRERVFPSSPGARRQGAPGAARSSLTLEYPRPDGNKAQAVIVRDPKTKMLYWIKPVSEVPSLKPSEKPRVVYSVPMLADLIPTWLDEVIDRIGPTNLIRLFPKMKLPCRTRELDLFIFRFDLFGETVSLVEHALRPYQLWHYRRESYAEYAFDLEEQVRQSVERKKPLDGSFWKGSPRALGFIHGTLDRVSSSFGSDHPLRGRLAPELIDTLVRFYTDQIFGFDHPTASETPEQNADWLIEHLPTPPHPITLDLICHSRGGLVARALRARYRRLAEKNIKIGNIIFAGTPNAGTNLVDPKRDEDRLGEIFITLYTNLFCSLGGTEAEQALRFLAHLVALGVANRIAQMPGFRVMSAPPDDEFLRILEADPGEQVGKDFAIAAEYVPGESKVDLLLSPLDAIVRPIHGDPPNDVFVPTDGVTGFRLVGRFSIPEERALRFDRDKGVYHLSFFGRPETQQKILEWLTGETELKAAAAVNTPYEDGPPLQGDRLRGGL